VYAASDTIQIVSNMSARLHFDKVILAKDINERYRTYLRKIAGTLEDRRLPWVLTLNLLNTQAIDDVFILPPDSVDRLICTGPLVGQEPPNFRLNDTQVVNSLTLLMNHSAYVEVPSADLKVVEEACSNTTGNAAHIIEVGAYPTLDGSNLANSLSDCMKNGRVKIDRLVVKIRVPVDDNSLSVFAGELERVLPDVPVYMLLHPIDESTMQAAVALHVSKFIVSNNLADGGNTPLVNEFLSRATDVVYRALRSEP
jgi:hypothetical protein